MWADIMIVTSDRTLEWKGRVYPCAVGAAGIRVAKREGDMATPVGCFALRWLLYRPDRESAPKSGLPSSAIKRVDGWCDDPADPSYNRCTIFWSCWVTTMTQCFQVREAPFSCISRPTISRPRRVVLP